MKPRYKMTDNEKDLKDAIVYRNSLQRKSRPLKDANKRITIARNKVNKDNR